MVYLTHVYRTGRMDIEMFDTPFCLKISFRGEDASRWTSIKYTLMSIVNWRVSDAFGKPVSVRDKVEEIRNFIKNVPHLRFDAATNTIRASIAPHITIPMTQIIKLPRLQDIAEESDDSWSDSIEFEPPKFVVSECGDIHVRCQDDIDEIADLSHKIQMLHKENDFLRSLLFRR